MTLERLLEMLTDASIDVDHASITVKVGGMTKRGEWYSDRIMDFFQRPMKAWNISCGENELMILCMY